MSACLLGDDCESSAYLARLLEAALVDFVQRKGNLQQECKDYVIFKNWASSDFEIFQNILMMGGEMLMSKALTISNTVGLACAAAVGQEASIDSYNGHCFNVGRFINADDGSVHCFILEGTAPMEQMKVTDHTPRVTAMVRGLSPSNEKAWSSVSMDMPKFLTMLGKTVAVLSQVANEPKGDNASGGGVVSKEKLTGWISSKEVINSLDSDPKYPMPFYNRLVFMAWQCTETGVGCMPVEESGASLTKSLGNNPAPGESGEGSRFVGIPPYLLADARLRGLDVSLTDEQVQMMNEIIEEVQPGLPPEQFFRELAGYWHPADPLLSEPVIPYGQENRYVIASCMESPGSPDYIHLLYEAKKILFDEANRLNMQRPDSDGIMAFVKETGTGCTTLLRVPNQDIPKLTFVECVITAMKTKNWPGMLPVTKPG